MTFLLHRAERSDLLADALADLVADPREDPFDPEIVVVAALGVERWLAQRLSHRLGASPGRGDGVCAGVTFLRPGSLSATLLGSDTPDPWDVDTLMWSVAETIDSELSQPWAAPLARHLGCHLQGPDRELRLDRRLSVARHLAGLLHGYAVQRPDMVARWTAGHDTHPWQGELWRRVRRRIDAPSPDERLRSAADRVRADPTVVDLPGRLSLFGHNRLPLAELRLLAAVAEHRDVHLWIPHPSRRAWQRLEPEATSLITRADSPLSDGHGHPLLDSLGRDLRELQRSLAAVAPAARTRHLDGPQRPDTLLGRLQHAIAEDLPGDQVALDAADRSIQIHACHGRSRQVDVLREVIVGLLQDDPTLEPRDVLVMCPDIEAYAPLFQAAFGLVDVIDEGHPAHRLRVMLADRSAARTNPLLALASTLLELGQRGRFTVGEVMDLASSEPVRRRFAFNDENLATIRSWVEHTSIRWGLDGQHRHDFGLTLDQNTWRAGLDRILLGVAVAERPGASVGGVLPFDDLASSDIAVAGRLGEFLERLTAAVDALSSAHTVPDWICALRTAVTELGDVDPTMAWQADRFERELASLGGSGIAVRPAEILALARDRWAARPGRSGFRTGSLTICTMVPMRSVPHRVVCLVGLDDGDFPRRGAPRGDDVLAQDPMTGERDPRAEDRQLLLDAIMSTTQTLVITYTGADEHRGHPRPPAVPLGEVIDHLRLVTGAPRERLVTSHPLQPFDARNLEPGALVGDARPFSFDPAALAGARAARRTPRDVSVLTSSLAPATIGDLTLADLETFFTHPVRGFLSQRLGVTLPRKRGELLETIPIELDGLQSRTIAEELLGATLAGVDPATAARTIRQRGLLPPGKLGTDVLESVGELVWSLVTGSAELRSGEPEVIEIDITLGDGRRLSGAVGGVHENQRLVAVTASTLSARQRTTAWIRLLALTSSAPEVPWEAHTIGKSGNSPRDARLRPVGAAALPLLEELVAVRDRGLSEPLPLPLTLSVNFAANLRGPQHRYAVDLAARDWEARPANKPVPPERLDPEHQYVWGPDLPFAALRDRGFARLAGELWGPMLDHETVAAL